MEIEKPAIINSLGRRIKVNSVLSNEEQRSLLPSGKEIIRCSSLDSRDYVFTEDTIKSLQELGAVLQVIHQRLIREGYKINEGKIIKP